MIMFSITPYAVLLLICVTFFLVDAYDPETYKSDREQPRDVKTQPDYPGASIWATPKPESGIDLGFVPIRTYSQVRHSHTVKHLPRDAALSEAKTYEEVVNAPRLREVVSTKKISEVYSEEGYEDSGYDHGGFGRQSEAKEGYQKHHDDSDVGESEIRTTKHPDGQVRKVNRHKETSQVDKMVYLESPDGVTLKPINIKYSKSIEIPRRSENNQTNVIKLKNPQIIYNKSTGNFRVPRTNYPPTPYSTKGRIQLLKPIDLIGNQNQQVYQQALPLSSAPSYLVQNPLMSTPLTHIQNSPGNQSPFYQTVMPMRYYKNTLIPEYNFQNREISPLINIAGNSKPITRLNLVNLNKDLHPVPSPQPLATVYSIQKGMPSEIFNTKTPFHSQGETSHLRTIIPNQKTILNINALADLTSSSNRKSKYNKILSNHNIRPLGSEKAMYVHLLTSTHFNSPKNVSDTDLNDKNNKGIRYVTSTQFRNPYQEEFASRDQQYEQTRRSDDIVKRAKYLNAQEEEKKLQKHEDLLEKEKDIQLLGQIKNWSDALKASDLPKKHQGIDTNKFPFYYKRSSTLSMDSPLRYATDPNKIPIKTEGGMEFYESRDIHHCSDVKGPGKVIPERGADGEWNKNPRPKLPRLQPLGDKIDCFKDKYFGAEPLDNPFFKEKSAEPKDSFYTEIIKTINNLPKDDIGEYSSASMLRERQAPVLEEFDETPLFFKDKTIFPEIKTENDYNANLEDNKPVDEITFTTERPNLEEDSFLSPPPVPNQGGATESYSDKLKTPIRTISKYPNNNNKKLTKLFLIVPKKADVIYITPKPKPLPLPDIIYGKPNIPLNKPTSRSRPDSIYSILANISRRHPRFALNEMLLSESRISDVKSINDTANTKDINRLRRFGRNRNIVKDNTEKNVKNEEINNTTNVAPLKKTRIQVIKTRLNRTKDERNLKDNSGEKNEETNKTADNNYKKNKEAADRRRGEPRYRDEEGNINEWQESRQGEVLEVQATSEEPSSKKKKQIEALINRNKPRFSSRFRIENLSKYETTTQTLKVPNENKDKVIDTTTTTTSSTTTTTPSNRLNSRERNSSLKNQNDNNNLRAKLFERGRSRFSATVPTTTTTTLNPLNYRVRPVDRRKNKRVEENKTTTTQSSINNNYNNDDDSLLLQSNSNNNKEENIDKEFKKSEDLIEEQLKRLRDDNDHLENEKNNDYNDKDKINSSLDEISINENDSSRSDETFKIKELSNRVPTEEEIKSEQTLEDLPRRLKSFERRKVTKEEIITRTFVPEKEESLEDAVKHEDALPGSLDKKDFTSSLDEDDLKQEDSKKYSRQSMRNGSKGFLLVNSRDEPKTYRGRSMTYSVNPQTGTGKWMEKMEEDSWESDGVKRQKNQRESDVFSRAAKQRQKNENDTRESEKSRMSSRRKQIEARRQRHTRQNEEVDVEERGESNSRSKIIKDPGQRLYYFANK